MTCNIWSLYAKVTLDGMIEDQLLYKSKAKILNAYKSLVKESLIMTILVKICVILLIFFIYKTFSLKFLQVSYTYQSK